MENQVQEVKKTPQTMAVAQLQDLAERGQISFPKNYNYESAIAYAVLKIKQDSNLSNCAPLSVYQALLDMGLQALDPSKQQCYFIKYGDKCKLFRSYLGDMASAIATGLVKDIKAVVIYEGDEVEVDVVNDERVVTKHVTKFGNEDNKIIGAYAVAILPEGQKRYCIMTKKEIDTSWSKSTNKNNDVHKDFPQESAKKTVIRRLVKMILNSSNTQENFSQSVVEAFNRTTDNEYSDVENEPANKLAKPKSASKIPTQAVAEMDFTNEETPVDTIDENTKNNYSPLPKTSTKVDNETGVVEEEQEAKLF